MQLDYIRSFLEVYRLGSMTEAARSLYLTQPAVSMHIKTLEASIGKNLFIRTGRKLLPTAIAHELAYSVSKPLDTIESTISQLRAYSKNIEGTIYIAAPGEFTQYMAVDIMKQLLSFKIKLRIQTGGRGFIVQQLEEGHVDFAILASYYKTPSTSSEIIAEEEFIPVASPEWVRQYIKKPYDLKQLIDKPVIAYDENLPLIADFFDKTIGYTYKNPAIVTVPDLRIILQLVIQGQGFSILPDYMCLEAIKNGQLINLSEHGYKLTNKIYLVWSKSSLMNSRIAFVKNYLVNAFNKK
ncbi:LysR family transcriptional regulator [Francisella sp. 19X1-34]|uniref:LysR family transcriptional regulator n=1 Tax=Francisella sp. 19X1-34 TaxID=3087177 RepID=UPI002E30ED17|nr:LysR family transcriptional regulator [Francisella sp. 19X1-34]MED7788510.1 LysR family transcriptional regulator [Francisella sp. 19X1-34]